MISQKLTDLKQQIELLDKLLASQRSSISVSKRLDELNTDLETLQKMIEHLEIEKRTAGERLKALEHGK